MNRVRASITSVGLAVLLAACGSGQTSPSQPGGSGGSSVADTGGSGGNASGGAAGNPSGGTAGNPSGGATGGNPSGGAAGNPSGGATGNPSGGATGSTGGKTSTTGGTTGAGGATSGTGGTTTGNGGVTGSGGSTGTGKGGTTGAGGTTSAGGTTGAGGATGTGGSTTPSTVFVTSAQNSYWQTTGTVTTVTSNADITVTDTTTYQTWDGFGGTFNEVGWNVLSMLSAADRDRAMKLLFDAAEGAGFAFGRIPIGASDYAMDRYSLDETANDYAMANFSIERDKQKLIPYVKAALAINSKIRLWASPWTPPTWMKTGSFTTDGISPWDGGHMKDDAQVLQAHALYLAKFVQKYGDESITIEAIHPQNEPNYDTRYPSCLWTAALMSKFIGTYLGPTFTDQKVTAKIFLGTMSNSESGKDGTIVTTVLGDATAKNIVKGLGLQWGMLDNASSNPATYKAYNVPLWATEHKCGNYPWNPGGGLPAFDKDKAQNDYAYAVESWGYIRDALAKAGVTSYSAWNMVLDTAGKNLDANRPWPQNSLLTVDTSAKTLIVTPVYYVFRHFSQFIAPGAKRVATSGSSVDALAFKNPDGSIVTVMYNSGSSAKTTTLAVGSAKVQFSVPANGFATVKR